MSKTRKKKSQSNKAIEAALQIALEQSHILEAANREQEDDIESDNDGFDKSLKSNEDDRMERRAWAQRIIQHQYIKAGGLTTEFLQYWLYWYLKFLTVSRHSTAARSLAHVEKLFLDLPPGEQDMLHDFHLRLMSRMPVRFKDQGKPVYHWINVAFKNEMKAFHREEQTNDYRFSRIENDFSKQAQGDMSIDFAVRNRADGESDDQERLKRSTLVDGRSQLERPIGTYFQAFANKSLTHKVVARIIEDLNYDINGAEIAKRATAGQFTPIVTKRDEWEQPVELVQGPQPLHVRTVQRIIEEFKTGYLASITEKVKTHSRGMELTPDQERKAQMFVSRVRDVKSNPRGLSLHPDRTDAQELSLNMSYDIKSRKSVNKDGSAFVPFLKPDFKDKR